ncbi:MAG TPA: DUF1638 domain-containing protein [Methanomassiliicoccales archaeon]|nr:DUF1638 domain-containing protein [Methanomassiliicoccales archaeon]
MRIGVLGCDAIRNELEIIIADDPDVVYREYLEFGLHLRPDELKRTILEKIRSLPVDVDVLFFGYVYCQALKGLPELVDVPVVMIEHEDCIAAMLTTERYHHEKRNGGITWFYPAGWAANGLPGMIRLFNLDCKEVAEYPPKFFLGMMFDGFSRCLFIDTGIECVRQCQENSEHFAQMLGMRHETTKGSLDLIQNAWLVAKTKASGGASGE